ncbi:MAG: nucleotide sugar dehydrogenase [Planctomycetaceae bacterium]
MPLTGPSVVSPLRVAVIGGGGHVGLPLGMLLCDRGHTITLIDSSTQRLAEIESGVMPFMEVGADELLPACLASGRFQLRTTSERLDQFDVVIVTIGTPVDEYLDPNIRAFDRTMNDVLAKMRSEQLLMIRSTVFPGVVDRLGRIVEERALGIDVCYCPERIAQGHALREITQLPQITAGCSPTAAKRANDFFTDLGAKVIEVTPVEAEMAKLFSNSYRYINFAISNQFYMLAERFGANFQRIYEAVTTDYPRMRGFARSGFAAGPCLLKDTMQLGSFNHNLLSLGQHAMMVNEGLPSFLVEQLRERHDLTQATVGILGMAFKGNCDDARSSLSYKLRKILTLDCRRVLCTDPHVQDPSWCRWSRSSANPTS